MSVVVIDNSPQQGHLEVTHKSRFLGAQIRAITSFTPVIILCNAGIAAMLVWMYDGSGDPRAKMIWLTGLALVLACYLVVGIRGYMHRAGSTDWKTGILKAGSAKSKVGFHILAFCHGILWGWATYYFCMAGRADLKSALAVCVVTILVAGGVGFAALPSAAVMYVLPIAIGSALALGAQPGSGVVGVMAVLLFWLTIAAPFAAHFFSRLMKSHVGSLIKVNEQSAMVTMLLDELQRDSTNWVWETDAKGVVTRLPKDLFPDFDVSSRSKLSEYLSGIVKIHGTQLDELQSAFELHKRFEDVVLCIEQNGSDGWLRISGRPVEDSEGTVIGFLGSGSDITSEKLAEDQIERLSQCDNLTGLMNRAAFTDRLANSVANLERYGRPFTVLNLDLDGFKTINDMRGHLAGDKLLTEVSERIKQEVGDEGGIARLAWDEFAILLDSQSDAGIATKLAGRLISQVSETYLIDGEELKIGLSIGIALAPLNGTRPDQLLRNADLALYRAKADGRGVFRFFENNMDAELRERRVLEAELRDSVGNNELVLHFQPLVDAKTHKTIGMESLIRWEHPIRGQLSPIEFVVLAEQSNLICEIGVWTLQKACESATSWPEEMFVAVNLSANHFMQSDIVSEVADALRESGLKASRLELEITESLLIHDPQGVIAKLEKLKELGVSVAMDDFGTGYSSLSYLMSVPFDKLKIDKSFVDEVSINAAGRKIVRMITTLAGELHLNVTAEGVESEEQAHFLAGIGCDTLQGYLFAKPMPEEMLPAYFLKSAQLSIPDYSSQEHRKFKLSGDGSIVANGAA